MRPRLGLISILGLLAASGADARLRIGDARGLAVDRVLSPALQPLKVSSAAQAPGGTLSQVYTAFGRNVSPPVAWEGAPPNAKSFVVIMEDSDGHGSRPTLHWLVYNIPGALPGLGRDLRVPALRKKTDGPLQGLNYAGGVGYVGPNPPPGDPPHHYHLEVFALAHPLRLGPGAPLDKVLSAMTEDVVAEGETVLSFAAPAGKGEDERD